MSYYLRVSLAYLLFSLISPKMRTIVVCLLGVLLTTYAKGDAVLSQPTTTCSHNVFDNSLVVHGDGPAFFVTGKLEIQITPKQTKPCTISWEVNSLFTEVGGPGGMYRDMSNFNGNVKSQEGTWGLSFKELTKHKDDKKDAGAPALTHIALPPDLPDGADFKSGPINGAWFSDPGGGTDTLVQDFTITITKFPKPFPEDGAYLYFTFLGVYSKHRAHSRTGDMDTAYEPGRLFGISVATEGKSPGHSNATLTS
jgi:hypothetical protein